MDPVTLQALSPLAQAGLAGVALGALGVILLIVREHRRDMRDVIERNTDAHVETAKAVTALAANLPHVCRAKDRIAS